jgi:hypothetical protein
MSVALSGLLRRCLVKDPHQRLHDIADARLQIEAALHEPLEQASASSAGAEYPKSNSPFRLPLASLAC